MNTITGRDAEQLIHDQIAQHSAGVIAPLAPFEPESATMAWLRTIRAIEEFINLPLFAIDDLVAARRITDLGLYGLTIDPTPMSELFKDLSARFGPEVARRFVTTCIQAVSIGTAFATNGRLDIAEHFLTVGDAIGYFQSRRRHIVAMLYTLPSACMGTESVDPLHTLNHFLVPAELSGVTLTGLHQQAMLASAHRDFQLHVDEDGFGGSHDFQPLDDLFLDPERASIVEMHAEHPVAAALEPADPKRIFSVAELRNDILLLETAYAEFNLADTPFGPVAKFVKKLLDFAEDDYFIDLTVAQFDDLLARTPGLDPALTKQSFINSGSDYVANTNSFAPFVPVGGRVVSSVTLLMRFLYFWKNHCLNKIKRFQIRSGFIFEASVKQALERQGFEITEIKRIDHKEFDVVALLDDVIYNVQCKNNLVDLTRIESNPALYARYNARLDAYYAKALAKEEKREALLRDKLGLQRVRHVVVSRFPVATTNPRIISFARIAQFRTLMNQ